MPKGITASFIKEREEEREEIEREGRGRLDAVRGLVDLVEVAGGLGGAVTAVLK